MHCGCGGCAFSDFICAVNYLEYEADWTVFLMADFFVSCVKSFKGDCCKKRDYCKKCCCTKKTEKLLIIHPALPSFLSDSDSLYKVRRKLYAEDLLQSRVLF